MVGGKHCSLPIGYRVSEREKALLEAVNILIRKKICGFAYNKCGFISQIIICFQIESAIEYAALWCIENQYS